MKAGGSVVVRRRVISLPGSPRRDGFLAQPGGQEFTVFDAIDGHAVEPADAGFDIDACRERYGSAPTPGEIGCALSHAAVIREFAADEGRPDDLLLVAEDDARFMDGFEQLLASIVAHVSHPAVVVLGCPFGVAGRVGAGNPWEHRWQLSLFARPFGVRNGRLFRVGHFAGSAWGTGLYLVTREAAQKFVFFVEQSGGVSWKADHWDVICSSSAIDLQRVRPNIVGWSGDSTLGHDHQDSADSEVFRADSPLVPGHAQRLRRVARATLDDIYRWRYQRRGGDE